MKKNTKLLVGLCVIATVALLTLVFHPLKEQDAPIVENKSLTDSKIRILEDASTPDVGALLISGSAEVEETTIDLSQERAPVLESRRMYMAHAPLRVPSVADPDSIENKRIMQIMIAKAISSNRVASSEIGMSANQSDSQ